jgi:hypothetical protein
MIWKAVSSFACWPIAVRRFPSITVLSEPPPADAAFAMLVDALSYRGSAKAKHKS